LISRAAALSQLRLFGIYLTRSKGDAVLRGDTSGTVVHPFFTHFTVALGRQLRASAASTQEMIWLHSKYAQLGFEQVAEVSGGCDASLRAQVFLLVASSSLRGGWLEISRQYMLKACVALRAGKLWFTPTTGSPPELTEDVLERLAISSQTIYFENYLYLAVDGIEPKMTARIEKEFLYELQVGTVFF
jgi:hypothetical protein